MSGFNPNKCGKQGGLLALEMAIAENIKPGTQCECQEPYTMRVERCGDGWIASYRFDPMSGSSGKLKTAYATGNGAERPQPTGAAWKDTRWNVIAPDSRSVANSGDGPVKLGKPESSPAAGKEDSDAPRYFGPSCPCHGTRNMERMGYCLYRCQESEETFQMLVHDGHIAMVPLETGQALEDLK